MDEWDTGNNDGDGPKALREYAGKLKGELDEVRKENKEIRTQMRQTAIGAILKEKGLQSKIANLVPSSVDPTEEKVTEWLTTYGDVFGATPPTTPVEESTPDPLEDERSKALGRVGAAVASELPPDKIKNLADQIENSQSKEELDKILSGSGVRWSM